MKEQWKLFKVFKSTSTYHIAGDKLYISNKGRIKLTDDILEFGKGLYISKREIHILSCSFGKQHNLYRLVYDMFGDGLQYGYNYNVHHKDYNHLNNNIDNLLLCTVYEHTSIHKDDQTNGQLNVLRKYNNIIKDLEDQKDKYIESSKQYLIDRVNKIKQQINEQKDITKRIQRELYQKHIEEERQNKINSGEYLIDNKGKLHSLKTIEKLKNSRIGVKESEESKLKRINAIKYRYAIDPEYKKKVSEAAKLMWKKRKGIL
jgi:hypothetical protein